MELNKILERHPQLGQNFENLGSAKNLYLQFNGTNDWSIESLNCLQKIFRKIFSWLGLYSSATSLKTIAHKLSLESNVPDALTAKITRSWNRIYPSEGCPLQPVRQIDPQRQNGVSLRSLDTGNSEGSSEEPEPYVLRRPPVDQMNFSLKWRQFTSPLINPIEEEYHRYLLGNIATDKWRVGGALLSIQSGNLLANPSEFPCIVNAANEQCGDGGGINRAIQAAAGPELLRLCQQLPIVQGTTVRCRTGDAVITGSGGLLPRGIAHIIHAVGPRSTTPHRDILLEFVYKNILDEAEKNGIRSLAIPSISTGIFGCHFGKSTEIALRTIEIYLHEHPGKFDEVTLVFLDHHPRHYSDGTFPEGEALNNAIENAKNCAWAIHIARNMDHPYAELQRRV